MDGYTIRKNNCDVTVKPVTSPLFLPYCSEGYKLHFRCAKNIKSKRCAMNREFTT